MLTKKNYLKCSTDYLLTFKENKRLNDTSIEDRVAILEFQVAGHTEDISTLTTDVTDLQEELTLVESEQIIQDERILDLEIESNSKFPMIIKEFRSPVYRYL